MLDSVGREGMGHGAVVGITVRFSAVLRRTQRTRIERTCECKCECECGCECECECGCECECECECG